MNPRPTALVLLLALQFQGIAHSQPSPLLAPNASVAGRSQAEWSRAWWQWAGSFERSESPVADQTGALCGAKQSGEVWFLAGTYGTRRTVRTCHVPRGKHLFFPLINYVVMPPVGGEAITCPDARETAKAVTDDPSTLVLEIDGQRVAGLLAQRQATRDCFDMGAQTKQKFRVYPSAANGYYVMLKPLAAGTHTINFGGALPNMLQAVTYTLVVE